MAVIRQSESSQFIKNAVVLDLADIATQAEALREQAQRDVARILADGRAEAKRLSEHAAEEGRKVGYDAGHAEGFEKGRKEGADNAFNESSEALKQALGAIETAIGEFSAIRDALIDEARQDLIRFALDVAKAVIHRHIESDDEIIASQLEETLRLITEQTAIKISVSTADQQTAERVIPGILARLNHESSAMVNTNGEITRGGCLVRSGRGEIDAQIETQIRRIADALLSRNATDTPTGADSDGERADEADANDHNDEAQE